jgi:hypothetical protein
VISVDPLVPNMIVQGLGGLPGSYSLKLGRRYDLREVLKELKSGATYLEKEMAYSE